MAEESISLSPARQQPVASMSFLPPPTSLVVRKLRAVLWVLGLAGWVLHRVILSWGKANHSLLHYFLVGWRSLGLYLRSNFLLLFPSVVGSGGATMCRSGDVASCETTQHVLQSLGRWFQLVAEDVLTLAMVLTAWRWFYLLRTAQWKTWKKSSTDWVYKTLHDYIPAIQRGMTQQATAFRSAASGTASDATSVTELPATGRNYESVLQELSPLAAQEHECWRSGQQSGTVYYPTNGKEGGMVGDHSNPKILSHSQFLSACYALYNEANPLHHGCWPKVNQCEAEVIAMTGNMLHCPRYTEAGNGRGCSGSLTSGGTESILLAIRANMRYFGRHISQQPELICGSTAHAAVRKACDLYRIRLVEIPCRGPDFQLTAAQVRPYITANTVLIYASAPCYPQGVVDDIVGLGAMALRHDVGLHVDACLGGFILPFVNSGLVPPFDFAASRGVTSMSVDTHKYGMAAKGTSVVLYRQPEIRHAQYFSYADWSGGLYATPSLAGSRSGGLSVAAWAALVSMGREGYERAAAEIHAAVQVIAKGIATSIPGLKVLGQQQYMVVCFGADEAVDADLDIYTVKDHMSNKHGWSLNDLQYPSCVHLCVTLAVAPRAQYFVQCLKDTVQQIRQDTQQALAQARKKGTKPPKKRGMAGIYGTVRSVPPGPVEHLLNIYTDETLAP